MAPLDWETLRHTLAIGNAGSIGGAARTLGVNHTTVLRRLDALEAQLGTRLFDRQRSGYQPTEAGMALLEQARHMATRADEVERQVLGRDRELTGALRLTTAFVLMDHLLPQPLAGFARAYPGIKVEVIENAFLADLSSRSASPVQQGTRQEADVALRLSGHVADYLVGHELGMTQCRVYALRGAAGLPQTVTRLDVLKRDHPGSPSSGARRRGSTTTGCASISPAPTCGCASTYSTPRHRCCTPASVSAYCQLSWNTNTPHSWQCRSPLPNWHNPCGCSPIPTCDARRACAPSCSSSATP